MNRKAMILAFMALVAPLAQAQTSTWVSDPTHSQVNFSITHLSVSKVTGRFGQVKATIAYDDADITKSTVTATVGVDTVDTGAEARDTHLKSADFFDVANLPSAAFTSTNVTKNGNKFEVTGNLTLHGVTKPVVLKVEGPTAQVTDQRNRVHCGFSTTTTISRTDFGIAPKAATALLGDEVKLTIEVDAIKQ